MVEEIKIKVLLVEDDPDVAWALGKLLSRADFVVTTCADGAEAVKLLSGGDFDVVVADINLPRLSGLAVADWVHKNRPSIKIIMMTAFGSPAMRRLSLRKGAIQYLEKPVAADLLIHLIRSFADNKLFTGSVSEIDFLDYLQLMMLSGKQTVLEVISDKGVKGLVFVDGGHVRHAVCEDLKGEEAFYQCLIFETGSISNLPWYPPETVTIDRPGEFLLMEAARKRDELRGGGKSKEDDD